MRRTENPENEVQVLKAPHDMVIVALHSPPPDIAQVAKRLTRRSAKPVCAGSNPALSSKIICIFADLSRKNEIWQWYSHTFDTHAVIARVLPYPLMPIVFIDLTHKAAGPVSQAQTGDAVFIGAVT